MTQDLNYYESGYIETGYYTYTADAESQLQVTSTMTANVGKIQETTVILNSSFEQSCVISHIEGADLFAFTEASLAAQVDRIRDNNIEVSSVFSTAIDGTRGIYVSAQADAVSLIDIYNTRIRDEEVAANAAFSLTAELEQFGQTEYGEASLNSFFTQTTDAYRIIEASCAIESLFTPDIICNPIKNTFAVLDSTTILTVDVLANKEFISSLTSEFTTSIIAERFIGIDSTQNASSTIAINVEKISNVDVTLYSSIAFDVSYIRIISFVINESALFTPSIICNPIKNSFAVLDSVSNMAIGASKIADTSAVLNSQFNQSAIANRIKSSQVTLSANTSIYNVGSFRNKHPRSVTVYNNCIIDTSIKKYGAGSLYCQGWDTDNAKSGILEISANPRLVINENENFYISAWVQYNNVYVPSPGALYPFIDYMDGNYGFSMGYVVSSGSRPQPYFKYNTTSLTISNTAYEPIGGFVRYQVRRVGSTITFTFTNIYGLSTSVTSTYSGSIGSTTTTSFPPIRLGVARSTSVDQVWIDELYFAKGVTQPQNYYPSGEIYDGKLSSTELLYHFNDSFNADNTGLQPFSASLSAFADSSVTARIDNVDGVDFYATTSLIAIASQITGFSSALQSSTSLQANNTRLQSTTVSILSEFTSSIISEKTSSVSANLEVTGSQLVANGRIRSEVADLDVISTLDAQAIKFNGSTIALSAEATETVEATRIQSLAANLTTDAGFIATCVLDIEANANLLAETTLTTSINRIRDLDVAMTAFYTELTVNERTRDDVANLSANFSVIATPTLTSENVINAVSNASCSVIAVKINPLASTITSTASLTTVANQFISLSSNVTAIASESVDYIRYRNNQATFTAFYTEVTANGRIRADVADLDANFAMQVQGNVQGANASDMQVFATVNAIPSRTRDINSTQQSTFTIIAATGPILRTEADLTSTTDEVINAVKIVDAVINLEAFNTQVTANGRFRDHVAELETTVTVSITATRAKGLIANVNATSELTAQVTRIKPLASTISSTAQLTAVGGNAINAQAGLQSQFSCTINTNIIHIVDELTYIIPSESRQYTVDIDVRDWIISPETREIII